MLLQLVFVPLGICSSGGYSKGPREKDPSLNQACVAKCAEQDPDYVSCPYLTLPNKQVPLGLYPTVQRQGGLDCRGDRGRGHGVKRAARLGTPVTNAALSS